MDTQKKVLLNGRDIDPEYFFDLFDDAPSRGEHSAAGYVCGNLTEISYDPSDNVVSVFCPRGGAITETVKNMAEHLSSDISDEYTFNVKFLDNGTAAEFRFYWRDLSVSVGKCVDIIKDEVGYLRVANPLTDRTGMENALADIEAQALRITELMS